MTPSAEHADAAAPLGRLFFERVLSPHRSLPPHGFCPDAGPRFDQSGCWHPVRRIGAWPVFGFFGLMSPCPRLRLIHRSARVETIRLASDPFTVERVSVRVERRAWRFQPFWLQVILEERAGDANRLLVASHGRSLVVGDFVTSPARRELATAIREALKRWREALNPAATASTD
jgi:uncharacterized membrane protein